MTDIDTALERAVQVVAVNVPRVGQMRTRYFVRVGPLTSADLLYPEAEAMATRIRDHIREYLEA